MAKIHETRLLAETLYRDMIATEYNFVRDDTQPSIEFEALWRLSWDAAAYFDQQLDEQKRNQAKADPAYSSSKKKVRKRDDGKCKLCSSESRIEVHHIVPVEVAPELAFKIWNMVLLCNSCHYSVTGKEEEYRAQLQRLVDGV